GQGSARSRGQNGVRTISGSERCVRKGVCALHICCPSATDAEILVKRAVCAAFSFAIGTFRGQDYRMDLVRAPSCKRRGFGGRHNGKSPPQGCAGSFGLIGGCDEVGASRPRSRLGPHMAPGNTPPSMRRFCPVM